MDDIGVFWVPRGLNLVNYIGGPFFGSILLILSGVILVISFIYFKVGLGYYFFLYYFIEILGFFFVQVQLYEYLYSNFNFTDRVFGSIFFFITGFHGFHVIVGLFFLLKSHYNLLNHFFRIRHCLSFEFRIFY
jgi:cytochrome c oxidase subunit 3